ncbi:MAG: DUF502 domain-containing protein [Candidatus Omnitrophota bacterium]
MNTKLWNRFLVNFFNGIVILLPITVTVLIIRFVVIKVNNAILSPLAKLLAPMALEQRHEIIIAKSLIFIGVLCMVAIIGWGAKILVVNRVFGLGEKVLMKVPVMGKIYATSKQIFNSLLGQGKTIFKQVVMVEYPRKGLFTIGFTTGITRGELKDSLGQSGVNVFVPTTPNPTSGFFLVVPKDSIRFLKMSVEEGMKLVVSGGSVSPTALDVPGEDDETF